MKNNNYLKKILIIAFLLIISFFSQQQFVLVNTFAKTNNSLNTQSNLPPTDSNIIIENNISNTPDPNLNIIIKNNISNTPDPNLDIVIENNINGINDVNLYNSLIAIYKAKNPSYIGNYVYKSMLKSAQTLDLSNKNISNISGLELLNFDKLISIDFSYNKITSFNFLSLSNIGFPNVNPLVSLNLANNKIDTISPHTIPSLNTLLLQNNKLNTVDLSLFSNLVELNLSNNNFGLFDDIKLPKVGAPLNIILINNHIDLIPEYIANEKNYVTTLLLQANYTSFTLSKPPKFFPANMLNISIKLFDKSDNVIQTLTDKTTTFVLPNCNFYTAKYYLSDLPAYEPNNYKQSFYNNVEFKLIPNPPKIKLKYKNKIYENSITEKIQGKIDVEINNIDGADNYYSYNLKTWTKGSSFVCKETGSYIIYAKSTQNGVDSEIISTSIKANLNLYLPDVVLILLILIIVIGIIFGFFPLIKKFINSTK